MDAKQKQSSQAEQFFFSSSFFKFKNSDCASAGDVRAKSGDRMCEVGSQVLCKWLGSAIPSGDDY